jgi:hypothetical protein
LRWAALRPNFGRSWAKLIALKAAVHPACFSRRVFARERGTIQPPMALPPESRKLSDENFARQRRFDDCTRTYAQTAAVLCWKAKKNLILYEKA